MFSTQSLVEIVSILSRKRVSVLGPSDYHSKVGNLAYESEKRYRYAYLRQLQPRIYLETISYPNEEDYNNACSPEKTGEKKSAVYHAAFKSKTQRFPKIVKVKILYFLSLTNFIR